MIKAAWFKRCPTANPPPFERIVQSWDTANKPSELADYSVCTTWGTNEGNESLSPYSCHRILSPYSPIWQARAFAARRLPGAKVGIGLGLAWDCRDIYLTPQSRKGGEPGGRIVSAAAENAKR